MDTHTMDAATPPNPVPIATADPDRRPGGPTSSAPRRPPVASAQRVVIKLGTRVLVDEDRRLAERRLERLVDTVARGWRAGREVMLVSSGAFGIGWPTLGVDAAPEDPAARRACAAVGQTLLVSLYQRAFARHGLHCAQLLVTEEDFDHRSRYLDLRSTIDHLLRSGVVPILNENDAVVHGTMRKLADGRAVFADNDRLAALVASKCDAGLLVLLTDVDGVYDRNPKAHPDARVLHRIDDGSAVLQTLDDAPGSGSSRGGMRSKVEAARVAAFGGAHVVIASGRDSEALGTVLAGGRAGTWLPAVSSLPARRRWIGFAAAAKGALHIDAGAVEALRTRRASLLHVGVSRVQGDFERGDVIELRGPDGTLIARGLMSWNAEETRDWVVEGRPPRGLDGREANCLLRRTHVVMMAP
ncbi:MAG: glutamate 5-kinase [Acidobacteriota bacterium]